MFDAPRPRSQLDGQISENHRPDFSVNSGELTQAQIDAMGRQLRLGHLNDEECQRILEVIQRDFELRELEKKRLGKIQEEIKEDETKSKILAKENFDNSYCIRCFSTFIPLFRRRYPCCECRYNVCANCSKVVNPKLKEPEYICKVCERHQLLQVQSCDWFYENVRKKFKRFGSAKVVRSLFRKKSESEHESEIDSGYDPNSLASGVSSGKVRPPLQDVSEKRNEENRVPPVPAEHSQQSFENVTEAEVTLYQDNLEMSVQDIKADLSSQTDLHDHAWDTLFEKYQPVLSKQLDDLTHTLREALLNDFESSNNAPSSRDGLKELVVEPIQKIVDSQVEVFTETNIENKKSGIDSSKHSEYLATVILEKVFSDFEGEQAIERALAENQLTKTSATSIQFSPTGGVLEEEVIVPVRKDGGEDSHPPLSKTESVQSNTSEIFVDLESVQNRPLALPNFEMDEPDFGQSLGVDPDALMLTSTCDFGAFSSQTDEDDLENLASISQTWENESITSSTASFKGDNWFFRGKQAISPYDNYGKKMSGGPDSRESTVMFVPSPQGRAVSPLIGDREADELSDDSSLGVSDSDDTETDQRSPLIHQTSNTFSEISIQTDDSLLQHEFDQSHSRNTDNESGIHGETDSEIHSVSSNEEKIKARLKQEVVESGIEVADPKFVIKPSTLTVLEGDTAKFSCCVTGTQPLDVFWYRDESDIKQLEESEKYETSRKDDTYYLEVFSASYNDIGQYMCIVVNELGQSYWTFGMKIEENFIEKKPPEFIKIIGDREVKEGQVVQFNVKVKGIPPPRVSWYKDGIRIKKTDENFKIEKLGNRIHNLMMDYVTMDHDAEYMVKAKNIAGEIQTVADLSVEPVPLAKILSTQKEKRSSESVKSVPRTPAPSMNRVKQLMDNVAKTQNEVTKTASDMLTDANKMTDLNQALDKADEDLHQLEKDTKTITLTLNTEPSLDLDDLVEENISPIKTDEVHAMPVDTEQPDEGEGQWKAEYFYKKVDDLVNNNDDDREESSDSGEVKTSKEISQESEEDKILRQYDEMVHASEVKAHQLLEQIERLESQVNEVNESTPEQDIAKVVDQVAEMMIRVQQNEQSVEGLELAIEHLTQMSQHLQQVQDVISNQKPSPMYWIGQSTHTDVPASRSEWNLEGQGQAGGQGQGEGQLPSVSKLRAQFNEEGGAFERVGSITGRSIPKEKRELFKQLSSDALTGPVRKVEKPSKKLKSSPRAMAVPKVQVHVIGPSDSVDISPKRSMSPITESPSLKPNANNTTAVGHQIVVEADVVRSASPGTASHINIGASPPLQTTNTTPVIRGSPKSPRVHTVIRRDSLDEGDQPRSRSSSITSNTSSTSIKKQVSGSLMARVAFWDAQSELGDAGIELPSKMVDDTNNEEGDN